jgi:hypothetical protein
MFPRLIQTVANVLKDRPNDRSKMSWVQRRRATQQNDFNKLLPVTGRNQTIFVINFVQNSIVPKKELTSTERNADVPLL